MPLEEVNSGTGRVQAAVGHSLEAKLGGQRSPLPGSRSHKAVTKVPGDCTSSRGSKTQSCPALMAAGLGPPRDGAGP